MDRQKLIEIIESGLANISVIESCYPDISDVLDEKYVHDSKEWLTLLHQDVVEEVLPDTLIENFYNEVLEAKLHLLDKTREEILSLPLNAEGKKRDILFYASIRQASNKIDYFRILHALKFALRNTVIVGPNGSGKTTLANSFTTNIHKSVGIVIPAQKLLFIPNVVGIPFPSDINNIYNRYQSQPKETKHTYEYKNGSDFPFEMARKFGDEMQNVILKFYADIQEVKTKAFHDARDGKDLCVMTQADKAIEIWNDLMCERQLFLNERDHFWVRYKETSYPAYTMSEGERNILYLIGRVLFAPQNGFIIIDEPELYLHKTIVNKLWDRLESLRLDCKFIYLTHDLDFAVSRNANKCWIRKFEHPKHWDIEPIEGSEIPEDLLLRIIGSRKKILFCEGTKDSFDTKFFEVLFPAYTITPVGSCVEVISYTRAFNRFPNRLAEAYGIIDRDVRPEAQIESFKQDHIYSYEVAEIENLFLVEDFIKAFVEYIHFEDALDMVQLKQKVISAFKGQIEKHAIDYVTSLLNYHYQEQKLHTARSFDELSKSLDAFKNAIDAEKEYNERKKMLENVCDSNDYNSVLKLVNHKGLMSEVSNMLGIKKYTERAMDFLKNSKRTDLLRNLFPAEL